MELNEAQKRRVIEIVKANPGIDFPGIDTALDGCLLDAVVQEEFERQFVGLYFTETSDGRYFAI